MVRLYYALDPQYYEDGEVDPTSDVSADLMHMKGGGSTKKEGGMLFKVLKTKKGLVTCSDLFAAVNQRIAGLKLPRDKRLPRFRDLTKDKKIEECHLELNSSETQTFAIHSITILEPLLTDAGKSNPAWICWLKHREVLQFTLQHAFERSDLPRLAALMDEHSELFAKVLRTPECGAHPVPCS